MYSLHLLFVYVLLFTLKNINSRRQNIKLWENTTISEQIYIRNLTDFKVLSYSSDDETGAEVYFLESEGKYYFYFVDGEYNELKEYEELIEIESPLFKLKSTYYFCTSLNVMSFNETSIDVKKNIGQVENKDYTIKCLRGLEETIVVAFLKTQYLSLFEPKIDNFSMIYYTTGYKGDFIAINNYNKGDVFRLTALRKNYNDSTYVFNNIKIEKISKDLGEEEEKKRNSDDMELFTNVELSSYDEVGMYTFVFTYEKNSEKFHIYRMFHQQENEFYEFRYFRTFKNFNIIFAKYLADSPILYYYIRSSVPNEEQKYKSYIGVSDIRFNLLLFNTESNNNLINDKIYYNYGSYYEGNSRIFYFQNNIKISFCPFVNNNDQCLFVKSDKFVISKNNDSGLYYNYYSNECPNKYQILFDFYCYETCPDGFEFNDKTCEFCKADSNKLYFYSTQRCLAQEKCEYDRDDTTCYDCRENGRLFYDFDCIDDCAEMFGEFDESRTKCITCEEKYKDYEDKKIYFSVNEHNCTSCSDGVKDEAKNFCSECKYNRNNNTLYHKKFNICVKNCEIYNSFNENGICLVCSDKINGSFYKEKDNAIECVVKCEDEDKEDGFGIDEKKFEDIDKSLNICVKCSENKINPNNKFLQETKCVKTCGEGGKYKKIGKNSKCIDCEDSFFFEYTQDCEKKCPDYTKIYDNNTCAFCPEGQVFYDNKCLQDCWTNQKKININYNNEYYYDYCENITCGENGKIINNECVECQGQYYNPVENSCYKCFCWSDKDNQTDYICNNTNGQCFCPDKYYGYICEFYLEEGKEGMKIITLNNRLIKSSKNYFTHVLSDNAILSDEYNYTWKVFFDDKEISGNENYKKYFSTSLNEKILGINKEIFYEKGDNSIHISLNISKNENKNIYYSKIRLNIIDLVEEISNFKPNYHNITFKEMDTTLTIKLIDGERKYQGRYEFQYGLVDENYERLPLTDYIESDQKDINLICPINFDVSIRNDREEEKIFPLQKVPSCNPSDYSIDNILTGAFSMSEKIFLLKSYLKLKKSQGSNELNNIINFIDDTISKAINKNGSYIENITINKNENKTRNLLESDLSATDLNIKYSEPKNIFSLMNYLLTYRKKQLNKEYVLSIFNSFRNVFEKVFINNNISNKTFSDNDIKSLFRTIDNLYDIIIERNITKENSFYDNFIEVLENISRYLSYKTYPSETIRLVGKRVSLLTYNLGVHQGNISFPYIQQNDNFYINNFSNYSFDNYNMQEKCYQMDPTLFCFTKENYDNFIKQLNKSYDLNNLTLNIFLMEEMKKNTFDVKITGDGPDGEQEYKRVVLKNNHSVVIKLINKMEYFTEIINNNSILLEFDLEFPFFINNPDEKNVEEENDNYLTKNGYDIPIYPDYSNYTCLSKSNDNSTFYCFTHFDFKNNATRCTCKAKLNDEITIVENSEIASLMKDMQFQKPDFKIYNLYGLIFIYAFILLLLIPTIFYLLSDIIKDSKDLKKNNIIDIEVDRKTKYNEIKKYCSTGIFVFSLYLSLRKFPYFSPFNKYNKRYPRFIKHLIIILGLLIGFIIPFIPYVFIPFKERDIFKNQRSLEYSDSDIRLIVPRKYYSLSIFFSIFGYIFGNLFIYFFSKLLNFEQEEIDIWLDIKTMCKDYIYYEVKSEVLLGPIWNKIKSRMMAYYYICGNFNLKRRQKNKFSNYLDQISRIQTGRKTVMNELSEMDQILPRNTNSSELTSVLDINNNNKKNNKLLEMIAKDDDEPLLNKEGDENRESILTNLKLDNNKIIDNDDDTQGLKIRRTDNFSLDNTFISDEKTKRQVEHFTKVRNKYIYINKRKDANEIEIDEKSNDGDENVVFNISPQFNYVYFPSNSFSSQDNNNMASKKETKDICNFIMISIILCTIFVFLLIFIIWLIRKILVIFDVFIIKAWIIPLIIIFTVVSFLLYYIKILIGSFLLFHFYHWRKKGWFYRVLYLIFVDQSMIYVYKVRNLITKYKKEFDYL